MAIVNQHPAFAKLGQAPKMRDIPVTDSSFLSMFRYDESAEQLTVIFKNGAEYINQFVDAMTVQRLQESANKSKFYVDNIRGKSPATKVIDKTVGPALRRDDDGKSNGSRDTGAKDASKSVGRDSGSGTPV